MLTDQRTGTSLSRPCKVMHVELSDGAPSLPPETDAQALFVVFWWRGIPLGEREIPASELPMTAARMRELAARAITPAVGAHLFEYGFKAALPVVSSNPARDGPSDVHTIMDLKTPLKRLGERLNTGANRAAGEYVSVLVCTRDRPKQLEACLRSISLLREQPHEVLIVDNAPTSDATRTLVARMPGIRYICEPRVGLSAARNAGVRNTTGTIVAFTDDDVTVHPDWITRLRRCFVDSDVMVVTGLILPAELDTEAQLQFQRGHGGFQWGYRARKFDAWFFQKMKNRGIPVWKIGAGANMAIRRDALELVGDFDERLGAGAAGCSEDSEFWYRVLAQGRVCRYEPTAVVFHRHRRDLPELKDQMYHYMRGHVTALLLQFEKYGHWGNLYRAFATLPLYYATRGLGLLLKGITPASTTLGAEIRGSLAGLIFYVRRKQHSANSRPSTGERREDTT
jgi:GT2 family glycosyltransferase